ncbi:SpoIID/LytB domain-containing protein [Clostridium sp. AM58-1XD]|uniref:SpoIID/LytB domain-containing protein n=1 Tax=Clostridium sp. AM58-1XD TaxID=2292307 RepID=UPI000E50E6A6|nr:SpoIID/LytB domain-containing protein [Clostridium sp. AM58-1XD]RGY98375.1 SpoIID/LytB domain-containing protein [Clostridium sp. AM58-1XD]
MKNRYKFIGWITGIPLLVVLLIVIIVCNEPRQEGISRALACKAAVLSMISREECEEFEKNLKKSHFAENSRSAWYAKYMDYLYEKGYLTEELTPPDAKSAQGYLTYEEADYLAEAMSKELKNKIRLTRKNKSEAIPQDEWWLFYDSLVNKNDPEKKVQEKEILVYGTPLNVKEAPAWTAYTSEGTIGFEGLALDSYIDSRIKVMIRDGELLDVRGLVSDKVVYENVWLSQGNGTECRVYVGNIIRDMETGLKEEKLKEMYNNIVDITMERGKVKKIVVKKDRMTGRVLAVKKDTIEIEGHGIMPLSPDFQVFQTYGEFQKKKPEDILVGYDIQEFVVSEGKVCAALIVRPFDAKTIRVLIMNTGFKSTLHPVLTLSSEGAMNVVWGNGKEERIEAGTELCITPDDERLEKGRVQVFAEDGHEVAVKELERGYGTPSYCGRLEVTRETSEEGTVLALVNELYVEDYLKRVVPSEMPPGYEKEALKAQAVCARTFAYQQIQTNSYSQYGAHVDDSTNYQVYNNAERDSRTDQAVDETYGKILMYEGKPIEAFYFSTSCGTTTDGAIWGGNPEDIPYLKSVALRDDRKKLDLTDNSAFSEFIKNKKYAAYDSEFPLYRWEVTTTSDILQEKVTGIGNITSVKVTERGAGGIAKKLEITGTAGNKTVNGQSQIRSILGNASLEFIRKDGKKVNGWDTLPSGFFTVEGKDGIFHIYGGGFGHGVGMSQNGAQGMAKKGSTYERILKFFYDGVDITEAAK